MIMPHILHTIPSIMLARGCAIASVDLHQGNSHLPGCFMQPASQLLRNIVDILNMLVGHHNDMAHIIGPPARCNKGCSIGIPEDYVSRSIFNSYNHYNVDIEIKVVIVNYSSMQI